MQFHATSGSVSEFIKLNQRRRKPFPLFSCRSTKITAVDIDEAILDIAKTYFGLPSNDNLEVTVSDGLEYLKATKSNKKKFNAILFDVDSKDSSLGISCPPKQFIEEATLATVKECLHEGGIFVLNLVCRDDTLKATIIETLSKMFPSAISYKLEDEVNEVVYCSKSVNVDLKKLLGEAMDTVNGCIKRKKLNDGDTVDVKDVENKMTQLAI